MRIHPLPQWGDGAQPPHLDPSTNPGPKPIPAHFHSDPDPNRSPNSSPNLNPNLKPNPNPDASPSPKPSPNPDPDQARGAPARCVCLRHWAALGCSSSELVGWQRFQDVGLRRLATCGAAPA